MFLRIYFARLTTPLSSMHAGFAWAAVQVQYVLLMVRRSRAGGGGG